MNNCHDRYELVYVLPRTNQSIGWGTGQKVEYATIQARPTNYLAPVLLITNVILSGFVDDCFSIEGKFYADETMGAKGFTTNITASVTNKKTGWFDLVLYDDVQTNWPNNSVSITATCRIQYISAALHPLAESGLEDWTCWRAGGTYDARPKMLAGPQARVVWGIETLEGAEASIANGVVTFGPDAGKYRVTASSPAPGVCYGEMFLYVLKAGLEFQNSHMSSGKLIDPLSPPRDVRVGVVQGDTVKFKAKITPVNTPLQNSDYLWSGIQNGNGPEIDITFNTVGTHSDQLQVLNCSERTGRTTVVDVPWVTEEMWGIAHPNRVFISPAAYELRDESLGWAAANWSLLGGTPQVHNCRADAGRHAYWNAIMTAEWDFNDAEGLATAHERNNLNNNDPHNESVMDLENNADGRNIGTNCGTNRIAIQSAVLDALNAGSLTILDDFQNFSEVGLLKPSTQ